MKLHAHHIAALDSRRKGLDVKRGRRRVAGHRPFVGMREVDIFAGLDASKKPRALRTSSEFQPTCGTFSLLSAKRVHDSVKMSEARLLRRFARTRIEPLHPHADAEERNAARNRSANRAREARCIQPFGRGKVAHAGQHDALGGTPRATDRRPSPRAPRPGAAAP